MNETLIQSYVFHGDKAFFVSTINRESSSPLGGPYAETLVWEWDQKERKRGDLIGQTDGRVNTLFAHQDMCRTLFEGGHPTTEQQHG